MWTSLISVAMWMLALIFSLLGTSSTLAMDQPAPRPEATQAPAVTPSRAVDTTTLAPDPRRPPPSIRYQVFQ
jgi:hypothetical protein